MSAQAPPEAPPKPAPPTSFADFMDSTIGENLKPGVELDYSNVPSGHQVMTIDPAPRGQPVESVAKPEPAVKGTEESSLSPPVPATPNLPGQPPGHATPQAKASWAEMRKARETAEKLATERASEITKLQEQLGQFKDRKAVLPTEWDQLQADRNQMAERLKVTDLESTPEYQVAVTKPQADVSEHVKRLSAKYAVDPAKFTAALNETDPNKSSDLLTELTEPFNRYDQAFVVKMADAQSEINTKRTTLRTDAQKTLDIIQAKRRETQEQQEQQKKAAWERGQDQAWKTLEDNVWLAKKQDGNDAWNAELEQVKDMARKAPPLAEMPDATRAQIFYQAALFPRTLQTIQKLHEENMSLKTALGKYQGATPGAGTGAQNTASAPIAPASGTVQSFVDSMMVGTAGR